MNVKISIIGVIMQGFSAISLAVNEGCNFSCKYCFWATITSSKEPLHREMTIESFRKGMNKVYPYLVKRNGTPHYSVSFFGTEPSLSFPLIKELVNIYEEEYPKVISYGMTTNGYRIFDEDIQFLKEHEFRMAVSFEGTPERQNTLRPLKGGIPTYDKVHENILKMKAEGIRVQVLFTVDGILPHTIFDGFTRLVEEDLIPFYLNFDSFNPIVTWNARFTLKKELNKIAEWMIEHPEYLPKIGPFGRVIGRMLKGRMWRLYQWEDRGTCGAAKGSIGISVDGEIKICHQATTIRDPIFSLETDGKIDWNKVMFWRRQISPLGSAFTPYLNVCWTKNYYLTGDPFTLHEKTVELDKFYYHELIEPIIKKMIKDEGFLKEVASYFGISRNNPTKFFGYKPNL